MDLSDLLEMAQKTVDSVEVCKRKLHELEQLFKNVRDEDLSDNHVLMLMASFQSQMVDARNVQAQLLMALIALLEKLTSASRWIELEKAAESSEAVVAELDFSLCKYSHENGPEIRICPNCAEHSIISVLVSGRSMDKCHHCGGSFRPDSTASASYPRAVRTRSLDS